MKDKTNSVIKERLHIVDRIDKMDGESAKKSLWYLLQAAEKALDCKSCPSKCEKPSIGRCMNNILDELEAIDSGGQEKYPGETWRKIPAKEHAWRAIRHLMLYLKGDKADTHLINAAMRTMMAFETDKAANDVIEWEKLMREKGCG